MFEKEGLVVELNAYYHNRVRLDVGNISKSILDFGNKFLWKDDRLIVSLLTNIFYADHDSIELIIVGTRPT